MDNDDHHKGRKRVVKWMMLLKLAQHILFLIPNFLNLRSANANEKMKNGNFT